MAARLEGTLAAASHSVGESEQVLASKEALMARWREEAELIAHRLDAALAGHRQELGAQEAAMAAATAELQAARAAHAAAAGDVEALQSTVIRLQHALTQVGGAACCGSKKASISGAFLGGPCHPKPKHVPCLCVRTQLLHTRSPISHFICTGGGFR